MILVLLLLNLKTSSASVLVKWFIATYTIHKKDAVYRSKAKKYRLKKYGQNFASHVAK